MIHALLTGNMMAALQTLLATSVLLAIVLYLRWPVAKKFGAKASYALWAIPVMRFVLPPLPSNWMPWKQGVGETIANLSNKVEFLPRDQMAVNTDSLASFANHAALGETHTDVFSGSDGIVATPQTLVGFFSELGLGNSLLLIWGIGVVLSLLIHIIRQYKFAKLVTLHTEPASNEIKSLCRSEMQRLHLMQKPKVALSLLSSSPFVTGVRRPIILLPLWFEDEYSRSEQRTMLAHEITHVKRFDLWALQIAQIFVALQWFNPIAHIALKAFRSDQEAACDADVLKCGVISAHSYSSTLLKVVRNSRPVHQNMLVAGLPLTHSIKERFILMQNVKPNLKTRLLGTSLVFVFGVSTLLVSANSMAHPHKVSGKSFSMNINFDDDKFMIDGKEIKDRRFVLLTDPMRGIDIDAFTDQITDQISEMSLSEIGDVLLADKEKFFENMPELKILQNLSKVDFSNITLHNKNGQLSITLPKELNFSSLPKTFNVKDIEKMVEKFEAKAEAFGDKLGKTLEQDLAGLAGRIDVAFDDEFGSKISDMAGGIQTIARKCADHRFSNSGAPVIVKRKVNGVTYKAVCVKGEGKDLYSQRTEKYIRNNSRLNAAEKENFFDNRDHKTSKN
ncbi:MAG: hypothetical protein COA43_05155 [Robiginitomaculum sp.]|nr:MAG: hypothetical protein COA43_05155 [Robiginitomaculum sp.]